MVLQSWAAADAAPLPMTVLMPVSVAAADDANENENKDDNWRNSFSTQCGPSWRLCVGLLLTRGGPRIGLAAAQRRGGCRNSLRCRGSLKIKK